MLCVSDSSKCVMFLYVFKVGTLHAGIFDILKFFAFTNESLSSAPHLPLNDPFVFPIVNFIEPHVNASCV